MIAVIYQKKKDMTAVRYTDSILIKKDNLRKF